MKTAHLTAQIAQAIAQHTSLNRHQYTNPSRRQDLVFARMHFAHLARCHGLPTTTIARILHRSISNIGHYLRRYPQELRFNAPFRREAQAIAHTLQSLLPTHDH